MGFSLGLGLGRLWVDQPELARQPERLHASDFEVLAVNRAIRDQRDLADLLVEPITASVGQPAL